VTEDVEYEQFDPARQPTAEYGSDLDLSRLSDIPMGLSVEIGRTSMTVAETLALRVGSVVTLERLAGEAVDLLANGTLIARGEVIVVEEKFGLHITELVAGQEISASAASDEHASGAVVSGAEQDVTADSATVVKG
jgi:flagellar motor switch protein FliN/FliY